MERETTTTGNDKKTTSRKRAHPRTFREWPFRGMFQAIAAQLSEIEGKRVTNSVVLQRYYRGNPTVVRLVNAEIDRRRRLAEGAVSNAR